jgi:hypothetical protein
MLEKWFKKYVILISLGGYKFISNDYDFMTEIISWFSFFK